MYWISSQGGPLILLDERSLHHWSGINATVEGPTDRIGARNAQFSDYDRACAVNEYIGRIRVGTADAAVLSGEPMATAWVPTENGGTILRWRFADSEDELLVWLGRIPDKVFELDFQIAIQRPGLFLFDSAVPGSSVKNQQKEHLLIELENGLYEIATAVYQPNPRTSMVVHRFELLS